MNIVRIATGFGDEIVIKRLRRWPYADALVLGVMSPPGPTRYIIRQIAETISKFPVSGSGDHRYDFCLYSEVSQLLTDQNQILGVTGYVYPIRRGGFHC